MACSSLLRLACCTHRLLPGPHHTPHHAQLQVLNSCFPSSKLLQQLLASLRNHTSHTHTLKCPQQSKARRISQCGSRRDIPVPYKADWTEVIVSLPGGLPRHAMRAAHSVVHGPGSGAAHHDGPVDARQPQCAASPCIGLLSGLGVVCQKPPTAATCERSWPAGVPALSKGAATAVIERNQ